MMRKYGTWVIFLQKYIYGIKTLIPLAMGLTKYDYKKFMIFNFFAAVIWSLIIGLSAYMLGELVYTYLEEFKTYGLMFVAVILIIVFYFYRKFGEK